MSRLVYLLTFLLLFITTQANAQDIQLTLDEFIFTKSYPPGTLRIKYGGLRGLIRNQAVSQFHNLHRQYVSVYHRDNPFEITRRIRLMSDLQLDIDNGGAWFYRTWRESLPEIKGGAPQPINVLIGPKNNFLDIGFAYITNDLRFKLREYSVALSDISPSLTSSYSDWQFRIRPGLSFSLEDVVEDTRISMFFDYIFKNNKLISHEFYISHSTSRSSVVAGIMISLLQW